MKKLQQIILGIIIIAVGVIWGLNAASITNINIFFDGWWALFIIVPSFFSLFTSRDKIGSLVGIAIGVLLILAAQEVLSFDTIFKIAVPIVIIAIGLKILINAFYKPKNTVKKDISSNAKHHTAIFSGNEINYSGQDFCDSFYTAIFGGIECDLSDCIFEKDAVITATAVFGGIDIKIPTNINIEVRSSSIFGGTDYPKQTIANAPTLYINATCVFGGVEIK